MTESLDSKLDRSFELVLRLLDLRHCSPGPRMTESYAKNNWRVQVLWDISRGSLRFFQEERPYKRRANAAIEEGTQVRRTRSFVG
jgi:hypothetical protein